MADAKENGNSDEKLELFCDPCHSEGENNGAISFCVECNEYLCKHCNKAHSRLAATREHIVKEGNDLPEKSLSKVSTVDTPAKCFVHGSEEISHFCLSHEEFCCSKCLPRRHQHCTDVVNVDSCLSEGGIEEDENDLKRKMHELTEDLTNAMYLIQQSHKAVEYYYDEAYSHMMKAKTDAFEHIEESYDALYKQLCETRDKDLDNILKFKEKCDAATFDMKSTETYLKEKKIGSKHQLAFAMKNSRVKIKSHRQDLKEIKFKPHLDITRYRFQPNSQITNLKSEASSFGRIDVLQNVIKAANQIADLKARESEESNDCCTTGLSILSENILVVADNRNESVKLVDTEQDKILSKVKLESAPWDVTALSNKEVAVTVPGTKSVEFLSVIENTSLETLPSKQIKLDGNCYGITNANDKIIVIVKADGQPAKLEWYDLDGKLSSSVEANVQNPQYVVSNTDKTKLYTSDKTGNKYIIERDSYDGKLLGTLNQCRNNVTGMAMDKTGVLYYCTSNYNEIDSVYIDEKLGTDRRRVVLLSGFSSVPSCLAICNKKGRLYVGKNGSNIGVYLIL